MRDNQYSGARTTVKPGQVWLIEHVSATALFPVDLAVLTNADVVIYDRALAPVVASVLPLGAYAEPLPLDAPPAGLAISARSLGFAVDGWSVAQLVERLADRPSRLRLASEALVSLGCPGDLPVQVVTKRTPYQHRERNACLRTLHGLADDFVDNDLLTLAFGPLVVRYPRPCHAFTANGAGRLTLVQCLTNNFTQFSREGSLCSSSSRRKPGSIPPMSTGLRRRDNKGRALRYRQGPFARCSPSRKAN